MARKYLYVSKSKTRKLLELYTLEGKTQEEAGNIVFRRTNLHGLSGLTVAQRVFHYLGVDMSYRSDALREGLSEDIIRQLLNHKLLAFPLQVPMEGSMPPTLNFQREVEHLLLKDTPAFRWKERAKSFVALAFIIMIEWMFKTRTAFISIPVCLLIASGFIITNLKEGQSVGQFIRANIFMFLFLFLFLFLFMFGNMLWSWL